MMRVSSSHGYRVCLVVALVALCLCSDVVISQESGASTTGSEAGANKEAASGKQTPPPPAAPAPPAESSTAAAPKAAAKPTPKPTPTPAPKPAAAEAKDKAALKQKQAAGQQSAQQAEKSIKEAQKKPKPTDQTEDQVQEHAKQTKQQEQQQKKQQLQGTHAAGHQQRQEQREKELQEMNAVAQQERALNGELGTNAQNSETARIHSEQEKINERHRRVSADSKRFNSSTEAAYMVRAFKLHQIEHECSTVRSEFFQAVDSLDNFIPNPFGEYDTQLVTSFLQNKGTNPMIRSTFSDMIDARYGRLQFHRTEAVNAIDRSTGPLETLHKAWDELLQAARDFTHDDLRFTLHPKLLQEVLEKFPYFTKVIVELTEALNPADSLLDECKGTVSGTNLTGVTDALTNLKKLSTFSNSALDNMNLFKDAVNTHLKWVEAEREKYVSIYVKLEDFTVSHGSQAAQAVELLGKAKQNVSSLEVAQTAVKKAEHDLLHTVAEATLNPPAKHEKQRENKAHKKAQQVKHQIEESEKRSADRKVKKTLPSNEPGNSLHPTSIPMKSDAVAEKSKDQQAKKQAATKEQAAAKEQPAKPAASLLETGMRTAGNDDTGYMFLDDKASASGNDDTGYMFLDDKARAALLEAQASLTDAPPDQRKKENIERLKRSVASLEKVLQQSSAALNTFPDVVQYTPPTEGVRNARLLRIDTLLKQQVDVLRPTIQNIYDVRAKLLLATTKLDEMRHTTLADAESWDFKYQQSMDNIGTKIQSTSQALHYVRGTLDGLKGTLSGSASTCKLQTKPLKKAADAVSDVIDSFTDNLRDITSAHADLWASAAKFAIHAYTRNTRMENLEHRLVDDIMTSRRAAGFAAHTVGHLIQDYDALRNEIKERPYTHAILFHVFV
jgi:hypothetical protein